MTVNHRTSSTAVAAIVVAVAYAALASCASDSSEGSPATPSPSPTGPCVEGTCEIEVAVGDVVAVPETYGLGPIEVTAISGSTVEMVASLTGSGFSVSGCSGGGGMSTVDGGGVLISCGTGPAATINDAMSLQVLKIADTTAVLRIAAAD